MKVAECNETFIPVIDGVAQVMLEYSNIMAKRGHEVYILTPMNNSGFRGQYPYEIVDYTSVEISKRFPWRLGLRAIDVHFSERIKMIDLDIIHVHSPGTAGLVGINVAHRKNIPVIGSFHTKFYADFLKVTKSKTLAKLGSKYVADFYEHCDEVWAVSKDAADELRSYGYKGEILIMQNGTTIRPLNKSRIDEVSEHYKIKRDIPVLLFVGQINWKKNLECVLRACSEIKKQGIVFQLVFAGQGPDDKAVQKLAEELNLKEDFNMIGHVYDKEALDILYHLATLFLFPSAYDTSALVVREAAATGTPSVVIEGTGPAEIVQNGINSFVCKNNPLDLATKIKSYLDMPENERVKIQEQARKTIPVEWDGPLMDSILERYQYVIDRFKEKNKK